MPPLWVCGLSIPAALSRFPFRNYTRRVFALHIKRVASYCIRAKNKRFYVACTWVLFILCRFRFCFSLCRCRILQYIAYILRTTFRRFSYRRTFTNTTYNVRLFRNFRRCSIYYTPAPSVSVYMFRRAFALHKLSPPCRYPLRRRFALPCAVYRRRRHLLCILSPRVFHICQFINVRAPSHALPLSAVRVHRVPLYLHHRRRDFMHNTRRRTYGAFSACFQSPPPCLPCLPFPRYLCATCRRACRADVPTLWKTLQRYCFF